MAPLLFCNIGWMSRYEGNAGKPDKIVGGGKWVEKNKTGHEVCNFLSCEDGYVYGHVETLQGTLDRKIRIEMVGGTGDFVDGVDIVWTATDPDHRGRKIVGWYRNARVFRERQEFESYPSLQHRRDEIHSFRVRALATNARCLAPEDRTLTMGRGEGWMGHTPWWSPSDNSKPAVHSFVELTRELLSRLSGPSQESLEESRPKPNSAGAAVNSYLRYVEAYEVRVTPRHDALQTRFERFLTTQEATEVRHNVASVDLLYRDARKRSVLAEIKPCDDANVRYAIRTAIGQLLDYRQRVDNDASLLIVLETRPNKEDCLLATSNGFGIAYPMKDAFSMEWPGEGR